MTIIVCLVGTHFRRPFDGIRYWSKHHGITKLYLLFSNAKGTEETAVFSYMSQKNSQELRDKLEILDPELIGYDPMDTRSAFKAIYGVVSKARASGEEVLIDVTSTTDITQGVALTVALMFRNARVYSVPPERSAWYVTGKVGDPQFEKWFENARNQTSKEPKEIQLPGYRLEPSTKHEEKEWDRETKLLVLLRENGGEAESISDIIRWFGHKAASSTLRNKFSRIVTKLEMKGLIDAEKGSKMKVISLTEFGEIFAEALAEQSAV